MTSTRREFMTGTAALAAGAALGGLSAMSAASAAEREMVKRRIPSTGEMIPVIGMGTSGSFEVPIGSGEYEALKKVLEIFLAGGATLIDTAPTYSNAEDVLGALLANTTLRPQLFIATKLSRVRGREAGLEQFNSTLQRLKTDKAELLQIHNLVDWETQIAVARDLKKQGKVKYVGVTHYVDSAHDQLADVVEQTKPDFLQINYSVTNRGAEQRLFPLAQKLGVAVLANRNFNDGSLFGKVQGKPLPAWAGDVGVTSWAQMFLKFALSHPAVTVVIPATGKPERQRDNLQAGYGPMLSEQQRAEVVKIVG